MYTNIRERRSNSRIRGFRGITFTCLSVILISCSLFQQKDQKIDYLGISKRICLEGSGRGRITFLEDANRFTYQSNIKESYYLLGVDVPFRGQETLNLELETHSFSGSLYGKISSGLLNEERLKELDLLNNYLKKLSRFIAGVNAYSTNSCSNGLCLGGKVTSVGGGLHYTDSLSRSHLFEVNLSGSSDGYFRRLAFLARSKKSKKEIFKLDLILDQCVK